MTKPRRIYLLSPKDYHSETIAVSFAKTSRSPESFDTIAEELTDEKSAKFHEKWVVGYGHSSVAEHAVLHLALENISRLAIETIESNRLASYTEKSTRYQQWDQDAFYIPDELLGHELGSLFSDTCKNLFDTYHACIPKVNDWMRQVKPINKDETENAYQRRIHPDVVDICRFLLPAASLANVGMTINARSLEYAICKMLSSPLEEVRAIGERLREVGQDETPTLIKYAACNEYLVSVTKLGRLKAKEMTPSKADTCTQLVTCDANGENQILAAILFRFGESTDYQNCLHFVNGLSEKDKESLVTDLMAHRGKFDQPFREFEYAQLTFESVMDQGAYFEFKRHRMMTQTPQTLHDGLGFAVPKGIAESGCGEIYIDAMRQAGDAFRKLNPWNPDVASYIIPNGYNRRVLFTLNLRQAFNLIRLRAASNAHFSIQRIAYQMAQDIQQVYPHFGKFLEITPDTTWQQIEKDHFSVLAVH